MCYVRSIRNGNMQGAQAQKRDIRDNYSEAANKSLDKTKSIEEKMNEPEDLPRVIPGEGKEMAKKLKEQVERGVGQGADAPKAGTKLNEQDRRDN
ncbi:unnamed protein product [Haemonchus placei]|uniref:WH2 domain-containing protein n=1 Tax=Haemonchus placei TaxID=6290 RepID=A0A0N4VWT9_HAEPC|nr:unnamed protein product [Haemonchus placei]